jgi:hypothetical protein
MFDVGVERLIRDLVTFVYADAGEHWIDEDAPVAASGPMAANLVAERHIERLTTAGGGGRGHAYPQGEAVADEPLVHSEPARGVRGRETSRS